MADLREELQLMKNTKFGREMRDHICNAMIKLNNSVEGSASAAESAQAGAETAREAAKAAQEAAETAQTRAKEAQTGAETAQEAAKGAQIAAETAQEAAKEAQTAAETAQKKSEASQEAAEAAQEGAETGKTGAEAAQEAAEAAQTQAEFYAEQCRQITEGLAGAILPLGTITSSELLSLSMENVKSGYMYNISDEFVTTDEFREGAGKTIAAGSNVYMTADGNWDVLAGSPVTGVKGDKETYYRRGNVNITAANVGALPENGTATAASKLKTARNITLSGDVTGSIAFDGTANKTILTTLANSGVTAGTYGPSEQDIIGDIRSTVWVSNNTGLHGTSAISEWMAKQDCTIAFKWKVSSENSSYDYLNITAAGTLILANTGGETEQTGYLTTTLKKEQTLVFTYRKDGSVSKGDDRAEISNVGIVTADDDDEEYMINEHNIMEYFKVKNSNYGFCPAIPIPSIKVDEKGRVNEGNTLYIPRNDYLLCNLQPNQVLRTDADGNLSWQDEKGPFVTFADGTWNEIRIMLEMHYAGIINIADYWAIGDEKVINLSDVEALQGYADFVSEREITLVIVGISHDELEHSINEENKAAVTVGLKECLCYGRLFSTAVIERGWVDTPLHEWCNVNFINALPNGLRSILKVVDKISFSWNGSVITLLTSDKCWLVSTCEANIKTNEEPYSFEGTPYEFYKTQSNRAKGHKWWTRTINFGSSTGFKIITEDGSMAQYQTTSYLALLPHFCI